MKKFKKYPAYKDSGIDWIGEIPEHWEVIRSKYLWREVNLRSQEGLEQLLSVSQYDGVRLANMESRSETLIDYKIVEKDNLVMNIMLVWLGGLGVSRFDGVVSPSYAVYRPLIKVDESYYHYLYRTSFYLDEFAKKSTGVVPSRWRLYSDAFGEIQSILPPLSEQKEIASFLDKKTAEIDKAIELKQKENELLKERRQVAINQAVTRGLHPNVEYKDSGIDWIGEIPEHWEVRKLCNSSWINRNSLAENTKGDLEIAYVDIGSVSYDKGITSVETLLFRDAPSRARRLANEGDIIVSTVRTYLKAISYVDSISSQYVFSTGFAVINPNTFFNSYYAVYFFKSNIFTNQVDKLSIGINYPSINSFLLGKTKVILPPLSEQKEIAEYLEELDSKTNRLLELNNRAIAKLKEYKQVLIDQAVRGQICLV